MRLFVQLLPRLGGESSMGEVRHVSTPASAEQYVDDFILAFE